MAKIKFGAFITDMRGKIGGSVFSRNKGGAYAKNKVTPLNPRTAAQQVQRQLLSALSQAWRQLDPTQRKSWIDGAKDFPMVNVFGDTYTLSGNMLYNRLNMNLAKVGINPISDIPVPTGVSDVQLEAATIDAATFDLELSQAVPAGNIGLLRVTSGFSAGVNNFNNKLRDFGTLVLADGQTPSILSEYEALFGSPVSGTKIGLSLIVVNSATGEQGVPTIISAIVS